MTTRYYSRTLKRVLEPHEHPATRSTFNGAPIWATLHIRALGTNPGVDDSKWLAAFRNRLPCGECRHDWDRMLKATPPDWQAYFRWTVDRHNEVSRRLGKPEMTVAAAEERWKPRQ